MFGSPEQELPPVLAPDPGQWSRGGAEDLERFSPGGEPARAGRDPLGRAADRGSEFPSSRTESSRANGGKRSSSRRRSSAAANAS